MINKSFFICKECRKRSIKEGMCWYDLEKSLQIGIFHAPNVLENSFSSKLNVHETKLESYDIHGINHYTNNYWIHSYKIKPYYNFDMILKFT